MSKKDEPKKLGKNGVDMGDRGVYDKRNTLNDLTGKEWVFFTNSVWITGYSPTAKENVGLKYRKIHPSPKPPALMKDIIEFFTKADGKILDPFCGVGGTLLGAAMAGGNRKAVGIELEPKFIEAYQKVCETENMQLMTMINDDSKNMLQHPEVSETVFDLIIADPPYSDMMSKERTGQRKKLMKTESGCPRAARFMTLTRTESVSDFPPATGKATRRIPLIGTSSTMPRNGDTAGSLFRTSIWNLPEVLSEWICALMNGRDWIRFRPSTWEPPFALWNARALKPTLAISTEILKPPTA